MELLLSSRGTVHHRRHRSVPSSVPSSRPGGAREKEEETEHVDVGGCELSQEVDTGEADRERQGLSVNLRVPMETERDGESEDGPEAENQRETETVEEDQFEPPGTSRGARVPDSGGLTMKYSQRILSPDGYIADDSEDED